MAVHFQWQEEYRVGDDGVDTEHQRLFELANQVFVIADSGQESGALKQTVKDLYDYVRYHFENEEQLMRRVGYPGLHDHVRKHSQIIHEMNGAIKYSLNVAELARRTKHIVLDWVTVHILEEDKKIGRHIEPQRASTGDGDEIAARKTAL